MTVIIGITVLYSKIPRVMAIPKADPMVNAPVGVRCTRAWHAKTAFLPVILFACLPVCLFA